MDHSPMSLILNQALSGLAWLFFLAIIIAFFKSPFFKGVIGEAAVKISANLLLDKNQYKPIHNVTLPTPDGTTQIDHIFVSRFGVFVVETKNYKGWIYGGERQETWTQKIYKQNFKFQNPLRQNYKHTKALESCLGISPDAIHSVIAFMGECSFKTPMPANVCKGGGYIRYIKSKNQSVLSESEVERVFAVIQSGRLAPSLSTSREHKQHVQQLRAAEVSRLCPKCGSTMVERVAKSGARAGNKFWGCSQFPACRAVQNVT
jgi:restriction system protein